jgi:hypothetical protein
MSEQGGATEARSSRSALWQRGRFQKAVLAIVQATFLGTGLLITPAGVFAAESADLDQCANDPAPSSPANGCATDASDWVNGNLNASKSVFLEGDSIPYRMKFGDLTPGTSSTVTIEWDTTKAGKHAIDYIDDWNESVLNADPCLGVSGCSGSPNLFAIPADPQVTGAGVTPNAGSFAMWGGTVTGASAYFYSGGAGFSGDKQAGITVTFTPDVANPVLAWGGTHRHAQGLGPEQLGRRDHRFAVPHAPARPQRLGRQPGPLAQGRRGHLPGLDHDQEAGHARGQHPVQLHGEPLAAVELQPGRRWNLGEHPGVPDDHELPDLLGRGVAAERLAAR